MAVLIENECLDFLVYAFFGSEEDPFIACSRRAYLDLCRTIRFAGRSGTSIRSEVDSLLRDEISKLLIRQDLTQVDYDEWHKGLCQRIVAIYKLYGLEFSVGQAQKWLNMTVKYLYIYGGVDLSSIINYCHIPLDNYVFNIAKRIFNISLPNKRWSRITDYNEYMDYQYKLRYSIHAASMIPLKWEFENWLMEAKGSGRNGL